MNNPKATLPILLAFGLGGFLGYIITKKLLVEKYAEDAQAEIDEMKNYYKEKYDGASAKEARLPIKPDLHTLATKQVYEFEGQDEEVTDAKYYESDEEEAQAILDEDLSLETQEELNEDLTSQYKSEPKEPYLIDYAEWAKPSEVFDKVDLYYYRGDDVVCDTQDNIIHDPEDILGYAWMNEMQKKTTVFVRNEKISIDYEIHSLPLLYSDEVTARLETDKEKKYRRIARQKKAMDDIATEHIEDRDEDGEYVVKRPVKAKKTATTRRSNNYYDYNKVKTMEDAEAVDESE